MACLPGIETEVQQWFADEWSVATMLLHDPLLVQQKSFITDCFPTSTSDCSPKVQAVENAFTCYPTHEA
jgi:hypothetical protein